MTAEYRLIQWHRPGTSASLHPLQSLLTTISLPGLVPTDCKSILPLEVKESPLHRVGSFHLLFKDMEALTAFLLSLKENLAHALTRNKIALEVEGSLGDGHQHNVFLCISTLLISDRKIKEKKKSTIFPEKNTKPRKKMENRVFSNSSHKIHEWSKQERGTCRLSLILQIFLKNRSFDSGHFSRTATGK